MIQLRDTKAEVHHGHFLLCQQQFNGDNTCSRSVIACGNTMQYVVHLSSTSTTLKSRVGVTPTHYNLVGLLNFG